MGISISEMSYKDYNRCLKISNELAEIIVLIEDEVRILRYGLINGKNHLKDLNGFGGHSFGIIGKEDHKTEFINSDPIEYENIPDGVRIVQNIERWTQVRKIINLTLKGTKVNIDYKVLSLNAFDINISVYSSSILSHGGIEIVPLVKSEEETLPDKSLIFWPYSNLKDQRVYFGDKYIAMKVNDSINSKFRIGLNAHTSFYYNENEIFIKESSKIEGVSYPNKGSSYECIINKDYLNVINNSPIYTLGVNECLSHKETLDIKKDIDLNSLDSFIDNYFLP